MCSGMSIKTSPLNCMFQFLLCFGHTWLWTLELLLVALGEPYGMLVFEPWLTSCKENAYTLYYVTWANMFQF